MSKHFNMGTVRGRVSKVTPDKSDGTGTPYLSIELECGNELYGNVKAYGRLWGKKADTSKIDAFFDHYKKNPGGTYRFKGFFSQYDKNDNRRYSNYTFFDWHPITTNEYRAAFVLVGEVTAIEAEKDEKAIHLHLDRPGSGEYADTSEDFIVYAFYPRELDGIEEGDTIEVAGMLRAREPYDEFDRPTGSIRPYAMEIKKRQPQETPEEVTEGETF